MKKSFVLPRETRLKLFLDECLSSDLVQSLRAFLIPDYPNLEIEHLAENYARGEGDEIWLPKLRAEGDWVVLTKDHGRDPKKPKLPEICKNLGITHILVSQTISTNLEIKHALVMAMPHILACAYIPRGTQVRLNLRSLKGGDSIPSLWIEGKRIEVWCEENSITPPSVT